MKLNCQPCGPAPCRGECEPWRYDNDDTGGISVTWSTDDEGRTWA